MPQPVRMPVITQLQLEGLDLLLNSDNLALRQNGQEYAQYLINEKRRGLLESLSYVIGIKALVLVAALLYLASAFTAKRTRAAIPVPAAAPSYSS